MRYEIVKTKNAMNKKGTYIERTKGTVKSVLSVVNQKNSSQILRTTANKNPIREASLWQ